MRIAIIGCGSIGQRHIRNLRTLGYEDLMVFDPLERVSRTIAQEVGAAVCLTIDELLTRAPDVACITSPSNHHIRTAARFADAGCHLFIEKPLSHSLSGLQELCDTVARREIITMVACNMRFHAGPIEVQRLLQAQRIGRVLAARLHTGSYLPSWRPTQDYTQSYSASTEWGGAILDCIHEIDIALWLFGKAKLISAVVLPANAIGLETDGLAELLLRHDTQVLSSLHLNFIQRDYRRSYEIIGEQGTIYWDWQAHTVRVFAGDGSLQETIIEPATFELNTMYLDEMRHFIDAVMKRQPTVNPIEQARDALRIALQARTR